MVDLCRVLQSEVEPWKTYVESSRVKESHGIDLCIVINNEVDEW